ncbi:hypothetical protein PGN35_015070 [Nodosilinea sp. PGN35]|uniref:hypothetical protein n=1 Tax=Nodosilinea sp. PGN35 TaxID=3020489 RepID=UPI00398A6538
MLTDRAEELSLQLSMELSFLESGIFCQGAIAAAPFKKLKSDHLGHSPLSLLCVHWPDKLRAVVARLGCLTELNTSGMNKKSSRMGKLAKLQLLFTIHCLTGI